MYQQQFTVNHNHIDRPHGLGTWPSGSEHLLWKCGNLSLGLQHSHEILAGQYACILVLWGWREAGPRKSLATREGGFQVQ